MKFRSNQNSVCNTNSVNRQLGKLNIKKIKSCWPRQLLCCIMTALCALLGPAAVCQVPD